MAVNSSGVVVLSFAELLSAQTRRAIDYSSHTLDKSAHSRTLICHHASLSMAAMDF